MMTSLISFFCTNCGDLRDAEHVEFRFENIRFFCEECHKDTLMKVVIE